MVLIWEMAQCYELHILSHFYLLCELSSAVGRYRDLVLLAKEDKAQAP